MRSIARLAGFIGAALAASAFLATTAGAKTVPITEYQLSLGDSLAFGYSQQLYNENLPGEPASAFEHGYVNDYYGHLKGKSHTLGLQNVACPGETTGSLIGNGPVGAALTGAGAAEVEAPCAYHYAQHLPLHTEYAGSQSQLEHAIELVAVDAHSGKPVTTLTLDVGITDELRAIGSCEAQVKHEFETEGKSKYGATHEAAVLGCLGAERTHFIAHLNRNLNAIVFALRQGVLFGGVNYSGRIVFLETYDPYGNVLGTGELLKGSVELAAAVNTVETRLMTQEVAESSKVCAVNTEPKFNTGKPSSEAEHLQKWTNMANTTEAAGRKNGPDVNPTPLGYKVIAGLTAATCG